MDPDRHQWHYLDRSGQEFGPFSSSRMRSWFSAGYFPIGPKLLVRLPAWERHWPVHELWPQGEPFVGPFRDPGAGDPPSSSSQHRGSPSMTAEGFPSPASFGCGYGYGYGPLGPCGFAAPMMALGPYGYPGYGYPGYDRRSRSRSPHGGQGGRGFRSSHSGVPRQTDLAGKFATADGPATTGMLRNIPNKYLQDMLIEEIDEAGFQGTWDFFYLPMDVQNGANVGYAFINFLRSDDLERFRRCFEGYSFKKAGSKKVATVSQAVVQGLKANVQNLMRKRVSQSKYRPVVFWHGRRVECEDVASELERPGSSMGRGSR